MREGGAAVIAGEPRDDVPGGGPSRDRHVPVALDRTVELLSPALSPGPATVVDATLGMGGHAEALLAAHPDLTVVGIDRDPEALRIARQRLADHASRTRFVRTAYDRWDEALAELGLSTVDGVLFDLGVSSLQLDEAERGFAYAQDAPLDMRMDPDSPTTAADVLNTYSVRELTRVLRDFGEEKFASKIASTIVREREREPFARSDRLVELLYAAVPAASRRTGGHPAKRAFQALRIEVNAELDVLAAAFPRALDTLAPGGRVVVLAYHSLEDRMVKRTLAERSRSRTPVDLPVELPGHGPELRLLTRGAERASEAETAVNPRAASVRLRAAERIKEAS